MARTLEQLQAVLGWKSAATGLSAAGVYCDFEDVRKYPQAVALARAAGVPVSLATVRIIKPSEDGLLKQLADCAPDGILVRNLAGLSWFTANAPHLPLVGRLLAERGQRGNGRRCWPGTASAGWCPATT